MLTIRQIERLWGSKSFDRLLNDLISSRPEAVFGGLMRQKPALAAAAVTLIRLDELDQSHSLLSGTLLRTILATQESDGGWGDLPTTALCLRALHLNRGQGLAIDRGLDFLAHLQQDCGLWPIQPIRRLASDPCVSACILFQLGDLPTFRQRVRFADAVAWFEKHSEALDRSALAAWDRTRSRCRTRATPTLQFSPSWS